MPNSQPGCARFLRTLATKRSTLPSSPPKTGPPTRSSTTCRKGRNGRLRQRLAELVREEVRQTVGSREGWQEELRYLISLFEQ